MVLLWEDGFTKTLKFGQQVVGITHNRSRPVKVLVSFGELNVFTHIPQLIDYLAHLSKVLDIEMPREVTIGAGL